MSTASGKNDGSVQGTRYFTVAPLHGLFVRSSIVAKATNKNAPGPSVANSSKHISDSSGADPSTRGTSPSAVGHASSGQAPAVREALAALTAVSPTASPPVRPAADSRPETPPNLNHIHNPFDAMVSSSKDATAGRRLSDLPEPEDFNVPLRTVSRRYVPPSTGGSAPSSSSIRPRHIDAGLVRLIPTGSAKKQQQQPTTPSTTSSKSLSRTFSNNGMARGSQPTAEVTLSSASALRTSTTDRSRAESPNNEQYQADSGGRGYRSSSDRNESSFTDSNPLRARHGDGAMRIDTGSGSGSRSGSRRNSASLLHEDLTSESIEEIVTRVSFPYRSIE
jgi:hypothetical protein